MKAAFVLRAEDLGEMRGPREHVFRWASVTKLVTALAALVAAEEGVIDLDEPAGPEGSTVRHLLAHASGLPFEPGAPTGRPGQRRIYSNVGFDPLDWGLGFELRDAKEPHWTGSRASPRTFGHFGGSGTFLWVDPDADVSLGVLTDLDFGDWAKEAWPNLSDAVLAEER